MTNDNNPQAEADESETYTPEEIETFFHAAHVLSVAIDALASKVPEKYRDTDRDVLMARAVRELMMDTVCGATTEEEYHALAAGYFGDDDEGDELAETHSGTPTVQ